MGYAVSSEWLRAWKLRGPKYTIPLFPKAGLSTLTGPALLRGNLEASWVRVQGAVSCVPQGPSSLHPDQVPPLLLLLPAHTDKWVCDV